MYVLVDAGFFVSRLARNWAAKGRFRRWMNRVESGKMSMGHFYNKVRKSLYGELKYLQMRINQAGFGGAQVMIMFDGTDGRHARGNLFSQYKANRVPADVVSYDASDYSIRDIRDELRAAGLNPDNLRKGWISHYEATKEADDLIAEFVADNPTSEIIIFTQDSDLYQLKALNDTLRFHNFTEEINPLDNGFSYEHYADWKALAGDSSDNIPGVSNLGPKKAADLVINYGALENIPEPHFLYYTCSPTAALVLSNYITEYQTTNDISDATMKRKWGSSIIDLREGKAIKINQSQYEKLISCEAIQEEYLEQHNERQTILDYRTIIKLPSPLHDGNI